MSKEKEQVGTDGVVLSTKVFQSILVCELQQIPILQCI